MPTFETGISYEYDNGMLGAYFKSVKESPLESENTRFEPVLFKIWAMKEAAVAVFIEAFNGTVPLLAEIEEFATGLTSIKEPEVVLIEQLFTRKFHAAEPEFFTFKFMSKSMLRSSFFKSFSLTFLPCIRAVARFTACTAFIPLLINAFFNVSKDGRFIFTSESEKDGLNTGTSKLLLNGSVRLWFSSNGTALKSREAFPSIENGSAVFPDILFARLSIES